MQSCSQLSLFMLYGFVDDTITDTLKEKPCWYEDNDSSRGPFRGLIFVPQIKHKKPILCVNELNHSS